MDEQIHGKISTVNIWWQDVGLNVPIYLIKGESKALIDAGPPQRTSGAIAGALEPFGVKLDDVGNLLLTHGHLDHVGGIPELKASAPVRIAIGIDDAFFLENPSQAFDEFYGLGARLLSGKEDLAEEKKAFLMGAGQAVIPDRKVADGDTIDLGGLELRVVHISGHSKGSVGYHWEKEGILIAGDAIPALGGPDGALPIIMDLNDYRRSIDRLLDMSLGTLVFTHGYRGLRLPPSTVRRGSAIREYLTDARNVADTLVDVLQQEIPRSKDAPFLETADRVIAGMPKEMGFLPLGKQMSPHFSVSTIHWGMKLFGRER